MPDEKPPTFNPNIPTVTSISGYFLEKEGWIKMGTTYSKDNNTIVYTGVHWLLNGVRINHVEDLGKQ